jgi:hypothetical protein
MKLKDEETSRLAAEARMIKKDDLLHQSALALLSNSHLAFFLIFALLTQLLVSELFLFILCRSCRHPC